LRPARGAKSRVLIFLERHSGYDVGRNETDFFRGILEQAKERSAGRFDRWTIEEVKWCEKEDGYIPYADLLAYLDAGTDRSNQLASTVDYKALPGYLVVSSDLLNILFDLDRMEETHSVKPMLDFILLAEGNGGLYKSVLRNLKGVLEQNP